jgi:iron complex transport system ATP-binding protein
MAIIQCDNISFFYDNKRKILNNVSFSVEKGQLITLLGPNGVGKSTLLNCITGLLKPQSGKIFLNNDDIFSLSRKTIAKRIAYVPQKNNIPFDYIVRDFVVMGRTAHLGILNTPSKNDYRLVDDTLLKLGILDLSERQINELSGGEQQKACIARALVQEPELVILDEPTAALDYGNQMKVLNLIKELLSLGFSVIQTTHNPDHCLMLGGYVAILDLSGKLEIGKCSNIMTEERLTDVYKTNLRLIYINEIGREICVPSNLL